MSFCIFLIFQAEECLDNFNYELAIKFCERALGIEPDNLEVLEMAGSVYLETGDMDKAKSVSLSWMLLMKAFSSVFRSFNFELCDCNFDFFVSHTQPSIPGFHTGIILITMVMNQTFCDEIYSMSC